MLITSIPQFIQGLKNAKLVAITDATADGAILYTAPSASDFNASVITSILVSEYSGTADTITVTVTDSTATFSLFKVKAVAANTTIELLTKDLILQSGDVIRASTATASRLHVVASIQEFIKQRISTSAVL